MATQQLYTTKTNFTAGQWSGKMKGRTDLPSYSNAVETLTNWLPDTRGGITTRPGSIYVAEVLDNDAVTLLKRFEFSTDQAYAIEAGNLYFRFFTDQGRVQETNLAVSAAIAGTGNVIRLTTATNAYTTGDYVSITSSSISGVDGDYQITVIDTTTIELDGTTFTTTLTCNVGKIVQVTTPYTTAQLSALDTAQSKDVMYITHTAHEVMKLERTSSTSFTLTEVTFAYPAFQDKNITATTIATTATSGTGLTFTASAALWASTDVGSYWQMEARTGSGTTAAQGYFKITGFTSSTSVTGDIINTLNGFAATDKWAKPAWSDTEGHPVAVTFFEGRLLFGKDQTFWGSATDDFENFAYILDGDDAISDSAAYSYTFGSGQQNNIRWFSTLGFLFIGTGGGTIKISGGGSTGITPTNPPLIRPQTTEGCAAIQPLITGGDIVFVDWSLKKLVTLEFSLEKDQYIGTDITLLTDDITGSGLIDIAVETAPDPVIFGVRSDGLLISCSILRSEKVVSFATHTTDGLYEAITTIPNDTTQRSETWNIVKRTINGVTKRYVEYFDPTIALDSALQRNSGAVTTITGLNHLEAKTVVTIGDNAQYPASTVDSSGEITISPSATDLTVGLGFTPTCTLFKPEIVLTNGSIQSRNITIGRVVFRVKDMFGLQVGDYIIPVRDDTDLLGNAPGTETGDISTIIEGNNTGITFSQYLSRPSTVLAIYQDITVGET